MNILVNFPEPKTQKHSTRSRGRIPTSFFILLIVVSLWPCLAGAKPKHELKLATLAPENSSMVKMFKEMNRELLKETDGRVGFKIFAGFALGDEKDVLRKLRIGLVHAATFTSNFLADLNADIRVMQVPFFLNTYEEVDYVLDKTGPDLKKGFSRRGYELLGWTEVGFIYIMTTAPIERVDDMKGKKVWTQANSPMANAVFMRAQMSPVTIGAPDVLVALQTNLVEVVYNAPYYALVTQWYSRTKYLIDLPLAYVGGALIVSNRAFSRLSPQDQELTRRVCAKYTRRITDKVRKDNGDALKLIFKRGVKRITVPPDEIQRFKELLVQAMNDLDPKYLSRDYMRMVREDLEAFRARQGERQ